MIETLYFILIEYSMKASVFFDHMSSYHPHPSVVDVLKKTVHPHSLSFLIQNKDLFVKASAYETSIRHQLGIGQETGLYLTSGGQSTFEQMWDRVYFEEVFSSGKQHILVEVSDERVLGRVVEKCKILGVALEQIELDHKGHLTQEILHQKVTPRTSLLSLSWANPLTGIVQPVADIAQFCKAHQICLHLDISHVIGKLYFDLLDLGADYVTFDAKSFHGPWDVGGLITHKTRRESLKASIAPLQLEALEVALTHSTTHVDEMNLEIARLRHLFEKQILEKIPGAQVMLQDIERLPHIAVIAFPYIHNEYFLYLLTQDHLYASIGGGEYPLLETLLGNMGIAPMIAKSCISFSFCYKTTEEEVNLAVERICKRYRQAQELVEGLVL